MAGTSWIISTNIKPNCKSVVEAIAGHREEFIKFPENEELNTVKTEFYIIARCPAIVGATDGTHVKIKCPGGEKATIR
ncbi:hypothetical protein NQ314_003518 [Rhamnusium bicolor]|uniref:Nuclease HARBI1 n=1 Tax=Rhamnusium bicolor TaxID=1586634 RepID=A0AAV8ZP00_9CUCU|nr:hypothetical protein NQ314_003518 [Rhamnusium bicolor]